MMVKVKRQHIDEATRRSCYRCPVALAMAEAGFKGACVTDTLSWWIGPSIDDVVQCERPAKVVAFVEAFDAGESVRPFTFRMRKP